MKWFTMRDLAVGRGRLRPAVGLLVVVLSTAGGVAWADGWEAPVEISSGTEGWYYPQVAVDGSYVHVVWRDSGVSLLKYRRSTDCGETWDEIKTLASGTVSSPRVAVSGQNVHVVWRGHEGEVGTILYRRRTDGGQNFDPQVILGTGNDRGFEPDVAAYENYVYVTWIRHGSQYDVLFRRSTNSGAGWESVVAITNDGETDEEECTRIAAHGSYVYIVWFEYHPSYGRVYGYVERSSNYGVTWQTQTPYNEVQNTFSHLSIAAYGTNAYYDRNHSNPSQGPVQKVSTNGGGFWSNDIYLGNGEDRGPEVAVSGAYTGNGCSVYIRDSDLYVSTGPGTETWIGTVSGSSPSADIGASQRGDMHVVCSSRDVDAKYKIYYYRYAVDPSIYLVCSYGNPDFMTIQAAIDAACNGDIIELCDDTFTGPGNRKLDYRGKVISVRSQSGNPQACIIDCGHVQAPARRGFVFQSGEGPGSVLQGVTVTGGAVTGDGPDPNGGGIACYGSSPTIENCIITDNWAERYGGGLFADEESNPTATQCTFSKNFTGLYGGGIAAYGSITVTDCTFLENEAPYGGGGGMEYASTGNNSATITNCTFTKNWGEHRGGGLECWSTATITDCIFSENWLTTPSEQARGGGVYAGSDDTTLTRCTFSGNSSHYYGGGMFTEGALTISNCTFYGNHAGYYGGGLCVGWNPVTPTVENTIIAFSTHGEAVYCWDNAGATLTCCDVYGNAGGDWVGCIADQAGINGNICLDPSFCNPALDDFTLQPKSPCAPFSPPNPQCDLIGVWPVGCHDKGDMNCDGSVDFGDINPFVLALTNPTGYQNAFPNCDIMNADINQDGNIDFGDINPFVALLSGG